MTILADRRQFVLARLRTTTRVGEIPWRCYRKSDTEAGRVVSQLVSRTAYRVSVCFRSRCAPPSAGVLGHNHP